MFRNIDSYGGDPILGLVETFLNDRRECKVNLGIGVYMDDTGVLPLPESIGRALADKNRRPEASSYLPMEGNAVLRREALALLFGNNGDISARTAVVQSLGGSGALKLGADFLARWLPEKKAYISDPTWDNHRGIFQGAGFEVGSYPYFDAATMGVKYEALCGFLNGLPEQSVVVFHPCCHNPTGADLLPEQWDKVLDIVQKRRLLAFMDMAYQGFGQDFDSDAYAVRQAAGRGIDLFVSLSFSKSMSLYGERVGVLAAVCADAAQADLVFGQLKYGVRQIYSSPPVHGAELAARVLADETLRRQWQQEVAAMRGRIRLMRAELVRLLQIRLPEKDCSFFLKQQGMFAYTGLNIDQVRRLRLEFGVYLLDSGRMCVAGLNSRNIVYVADALADAFRQP